ncbi:MAG: hypothetical protein A3G93_00390 [Nitrospinae bacterium RIFCSPLOWO2_12_FULL_45_22]|nr:MAG: hypothetical protein A3G93_00390 [Nitrospinae bacterium RIFCSPLOWO2_12_FULL_45_22]
MRTATQDIKSAIAESLKAFGNGSLRTNAIQLFNTLGYTSEKTIELSPNTPENFLHEIDQHNRLRKDKALFSRWESLDIIFQITGEEIKAAGSRQISLQFDSRQKIDNRIIESYLLLAIKLRKGHYTRTDLSTITREINRLFPMPALILFQQGDTLTLSVINRRLHKRDQSKDVLEKVTLIKDIRFADPHRAHIEILFDLSFRNLYDRYRFSNFVALHDAWQKTLDINELNKRFYKEMANWYFWAIQNVTFPKDAGEDEEVRNATSVIRLITRLIFVWFIKEKGLVPDDLFNRDKLDALLKFDDPNQSTYYKALLQNLFFATLNQEMNTPEQPDNRKFRSKAKKAGGRDQHYMIHNVYRCENYFKDPDKALRLFSSIPFLNGGLFECLDKPDKEEPQKTLRIDGFSDHKDNEVVVPDFLFFSQEQEVDLNESYGTKNKQYKVRGLINIFDSYKFTINENTPIEEEVALDPELLGKVFENLLAAYNPETGATARKQTGSFYTPREIVDYMVDESLKASLSNLVAEKLTDCSKEDIRTGLDILFAYTEKEHAFNDKEVSKIVEAVSQIKILDPACGSGAFPMGVLHKLVYILGKLDLDNAQWRELQKQRAMKETEEAYNMGNKEDRRQRLSEIEEAFDFNTSDYGRKLYLIENCIYGVDIQPIAVQIAKLRFFISLVVDQEIDDTQENRGILPLPNLETKFVAANTLLNVEKPQQPNLANLKVRAEIDRKERELADVRRNHFIARTLKTKRKWRERDAQLRAEISDLLKKEDFPPETTQKLAYWDPYDQNASADFFDPEWMFNLSDGFDVVIGNPPYVRADSGEQHLALRKTIEDNKLYETLWEKWDLYIPFIERGYKLLKPGGFTTMIVSDAFCHSKYAQKSQNWFLEHSRILRLDFFSKIKIFDAAVHNITYLFQKADGRHHRPERRVHDPEFGAVKILPTAEQRKLNYRAFFPEDTVPQQLHNSTIVLSSICYISYGLRPSSDEHEAKGAFTTSDLVSETRDQLHCKAFVEGKHLDCWIPLTNLWIEWGSDRAPSKFCRPTFPEMYAVAEKVLAQRSPGPDPKACYDNKRLIFTPSSVGFIPWHSLSGVRNRSLKKSARYRNEKPPRPDLPKREELEKTSRRFAVKFLLAVMNSTAAHNFLRANRRSNIHLYPDDWKHLPIPDASSKQQTPIVKLVDKILTAMRADPAAHITSLEAEIDARVAHLYELTEEEYSLILNETKPPDPFRIAALNFYRDIARGILK